MHFRVTMSDGFSNLMQPIHLDHPCVLCCVARSEHVHEYTNPGSQHSDQNYQQLRDPMASTAGPRLTAHVRHRNACFEYIIAMSSHLGEGSTVTRKANILMTLVAVMVAITRVIMAKPEYGTCTAVRQLTWSRVPAVFFRRLTSEYQLISPVHAIQRSQQLQAQTLNSTGCCYIDHGGTPSLRRRALRQNALCHPCIALQFCRR